ncbi:hypothetical protein SAMN05216567_111258 [Variovorax sp. OK605]|uniref:DUF6882 domain-containing protein n=1 Tax=Variovorax sp. OK605 TaxID=1855317 RepID=UPI0008EF167D|nr:DUF6882 domain-containing protein [Variovorax sp. OK605]SFQ16886.1 hypothetical protein SAMN05216567_111258 [Variovorax sp. OK605]
MSTFQDHFADHAASSFARQIALGDVIGERPWGIDMQKGLLRFGDDLEYPVQLLGTHAFEPRTWLWVWANTQSNLPPQLTEAALRIRQLGEAQAVEALTQPSLQLDDITDHMIAMTCSGLEGGRCYYRAPYDGGALFVLLDDVPAEVLAPVSLPRVNTVLMEVISQFDVDHRRMVASFLRQQGLHAASNGVGGIRAERAGEGHIEISFDELGRISNVAATLGPAASAPSTQAAPKKSRWQVWK